MTPDTTAWTVEREIGAPREVVWRALTEPEELERWFGWEAPGLAHEIRFIFVDHAHPTPQDRIDLGGGQALELAEGAAGTVVRALQARDAAAGGGPDDGVYDGMREGWRAFFTQLAHLLERAPGQDRRTLYLTGQGSTRAVAGALAALGGDEVASSRFQRGVVVPAGEGGPPSGILAVLDAREPLDADPGGLVRMTVTLTAHGVDAAAWTAIAGRWTTWWDGVVETQAPGG